MYEICKNLSYKKILVWEVGIFYLRLRNDL